jgi:hypothetical protein
VCRIITPAQELASFGTGEKTQKTQRHNFQVLEITAQTSDNTTEKTSKMSW